MAKKYFTIEEANAMLPELRQRLTRIKQIRVQTQIISQYLTEIGYIADEAFVELIPEDLNSEIIDEMTSLKLLIDELNKQVNELIGAGVLVKDIERGLVDWYAKKDDRDILLCWQMGENKISYWHETEDGFKGRKPIDKD